MTDLSVSRDGSAVLVATVPNPEAGPAVPRETGHGLTRFDRAGRKLWHIELEGTVRSLALSDDGKLALVSTYDNKISGIDARGKTVWSVDGMCRPVPMGKRFLCYHDDDAEADVAFDVYSGSGRKILFYPVAHDVLALKVSDDERNTVIALEGGTIMLFDSDFQTIWKSQVPGEVLDLAVASGEHPRVTALFNRPAAPDSAGIPAQGIYFFDGAGRLAGEAVPRTRFEQIEFVPSGAGVAAYGNGAQGQNLAFYDLSGAPPVSAGVTGVPEFSEKWRRGDSHAADFSSSMIVTNEQIIMGFEQIAMTARQSHLVALDFEGALKWDLPLVTEEGAYLYAHGFAPIPSLISVGTDDGTLSAFQLAAAGPRKH